MGARLLWFLAWNRRPVYVTAVGIGFLGAIQTKSVYGLVVGLLPFALLYRAVALVKSQGPSIIETARAMALKAGAERTGVPLETSTGFATTIAVGSSPVGIKLAPRYHCDCFYVNDAFFATFIGTSISLPDRSLQPANSGEEIYFRHVTAISQNSGAIEISIGRNVKPRLVEVGTDPEAVKLVETLKARLRAPKVAQAVTARSPVLTMDALPVSEPSPRLLTTEAERCCYLRPEKLAEYYSDPQVIDALMDQLEVPGTTAAHKMMSPDQKRAAIDAQITHFTNTPASFWYRVPHFEVLAASLWRCGGGPLSQRVIYDKFYDVAREDDLRRPIARWLASRNEEPYMEIHLGRRRIDVLGFDRRSGRLTAVELKNTDAEFRRGPDQMGSFTEYAHAVYLACTPAFAADYLERNADHRSVNHWDPTLLDRKLKQGGFGLLIVERNSVFELIKPVEQTPSPERVQKIASGLTNFHKVDLD
jgi:hypothetical protein